MGEGYLANTEYRFLQIRLPASLPRYLVTQPRLLVAGKETEETEGIMIL